MPEIDFDNLVKAFEFGSTYPAASAAATGASYNSPTSNLQQLVTRTLQGVLGRSFKPGDYKSFKAALDGSFESKLVDNKSVYEHKQRSYPAIGATDIGGGVSGAQYSLVSFASALHEQTETLIENLHSLNPSVDEEEFEATKAIFRTAWDELIDELSREGGPRASRADGLATSIFSGNGDGHLVTLGQMLEVVSQVTKPQNNRGLVGKIEFSRSKVVTSEEEGYLTSFIALTDYYFAVASAWQNYRDTFLGKDLGSGLLLLERALVVVEEVANEVYQAMDSVNIDQAERLVITIGFDPPDDNLTVEDLLSWIVSFASREGPMLIRDGGRLGVRAIIPTANKLEELTSMFVKLIHPDSSQSSQADASSQGPGKAAGQSKGSKTDSYTGNTTSAQLPDQFNHSRVIHPLKELQRHFRELVKQAKAIAESEPTTGSQTAK